MLWGYGPAVDIVEEISIEKSLAQREELNILIVGSADGRHILQTIAKQYTHPKQKVTFYVVEVLLDMIARQMLLVLTALEPPERLGLFEKTRTWMELYGNTLMRPKTSKYLVQKAYQLIHLVTDEMYLSSRLPLVSISMMKYKERDNLETIFQFWAKNRFENIISLWDSRVRQGLGVRYDVKDGVFDWDYHMRLKEIPNCARINSREYKHWRATGVAFTWLESEVSEPNPTLAAGIVKLGDRLLNHGYLGDIVTPPYVDFGTDCEDEDMLVVRHGVHAHRSTDITEVNLRRMFHEISTRTEYRVAVPTDKRLGAVITELPDVKEEVPQREIDVPMSEDPRRKEDYCAIPVEGMRVEFLSTSALLDLPKKPGFKGAFDVIMVSQNLAQRLTSEVMTLAKDGALLMVETRKFLTTTTVKEKKDFADHIRELAEGLQCELLQPLDGVSDYLAKFRLARH